MDPTWRSPEILRRLPGGAPGVRGHLREGLWSSLGAVLALSADLAADPASGSRRLSCGPTWQQPQTVLEVHFDD